MDSDVLKMKPETPECAVKKICVTGKGGVGKSTIVSVLARQFADKGYKVLVIDTDESNPGLYRKLAMDGEPKQLIRFLDGFNMDYGLPENTWISEDVITFGDIPDEYLETKGNISLIEIGKIDHPHQGCACSMADFSKQLMKSLKPGEQEIVIADLEAGVESYGRGIEEGADTIIAVTETSYDSVKLAQLITKMSKDMGIDRVYTIVNRVPDKKLDEMINKVTSSYDIVPMGFLCYDDDTMESGFEGKPVGEDTYLYTSVRQMAEAVNLIY